MFCSLALPSQKWLGVRCSRKLKVASFSDTEPLDNYSYALYTSPPFSNLADRTGQRESYGFEMY